MAAPAYVTEDVLAAALVGLEGRLAALISASSQKSRKQGRSPFIALGSLSDDQQSDGNDDVDESGDQDQGQSGDEEKTPSSSQALRMQVQYYTELVRDAYKLPSTESAGSPIPSLGVFKVPAGCIYLSVPSVSGKAYVY